MIKTYSLAKYGRSYKLSNHFTLGEMACKDGSDTVKVSTELIDMLEKLRTYVGGTISINSGYRTSAYNKKIGGASASQHIQGTAADIIVKNHNGEIIDGRLVCCLCQTLGFKGVAWINYRSTHVDMRSSGIYRGTESKGYGNNVGGDFYKYFGITKAQIEKLKYAEAPAQPQVKPIEPTPVQPPAPAQDEDDEMRYKTIKEVPSYAKDSVQLRIDLGLTSGEDLTESMVRNWVIEDRENPYIKNITDAPKWAQADLKEMISAGYLKGNGKEEIGMRLASLRACIVSYRMIKK